MFISNFTDRWPNVSWDGKRIVRLNKCVLTFGDGKQKIRLAIKRSSQMATAIENQHFYTF